MDDQVSETNASAIELDERERRIESAERDAYLVRGQELRAIREGKLLGCATTFQRSVNTASSVGS